MARNLLAELIVRLTDGVSGPAKKLAQSLKGVETAVDALNKSGNAAGLNRTATALDRMAASAKMMAAQGAKLDNLPQSFLNRLGKLKLPVEEIEKFRAAYRRLAQEMATADRATRSMALRNFREDFLLMATGADRAAASVRRFGINAAAARREVAALSNLTRVFGWGGLAYAAQRGARLGLTAAADYRREDWRQQMGGISAPDRAVLQSRAMGLSMKYRSVDATNINEIGRAIYNMTGDMPKAVDLLEDFTRAYVVLQSVKGKEGATKELEDFSKAIDVLGRQENPEELRAILNAALKATQVEGRQLPLTEFLKLAKYSKSAGAAFSPEFLGAVAPTMMQEEGGQRFGTSMGSMVSQMIGGTRMTRRAMNTQIDLGLRSRGNDKKVLEADLLMSNPYDWAQKHLYPIMKEKMGFDPREAGNESKVVEFMSTIFSNQMVANAFTKFFTQYDQIERNRNILYPAAMGSAAADEAIQKDPFVALEGVFAQLRNLMVVLGEAGATEAIMSFLNRFSSSIAELNKFLLENPGAANIGSTLMAIAGGLVALRLALAGWRLLGLGGMFGWMRPAAQAAAVGAGVGAGAAAAAGAGAGATAASASRLAMFARGAGTAARGMMFIPGLGWVVGGAGLAYGLYSGDGDVAPGDLSDQEKAIREVARRWRRAPRPAVTAEQAGVPGDIGSSGSLQFGIGGFRPRIDVNEFVKADEHATHTKQKLDELGATSVKPRVDTADLERAVGLANQFLASLRQISAAGSAVPRRMESEIRTAMRSAYSDYGMEESG